jgi:hypothetical protein
MTPTKGENMSTTPNELAAAAKRLRATQPAGDPYADIPWQMGEPGDAEEGAKVGEAWALHRATAEELKRMYAGKHGPEFDKRMAQWSRDLKFIRRLRQRNSQMYCEAFLDAAVGVWEQILTRI